MDDSTNTTDKPSISVRIYHRLPSTVKNKFEAHARAQGAAIGELAGYTFRRLIFCANRFFDAGGTISELCDLIQLGSDLLGHGLCFREARKKIKEIARKD